MTYKEEKGISLKQLIAMFVLASAAPLVRSIPGLAAKTAGAAAWLSPLIVILLGILSVITLNKLINGIKGKDGNERNIKNLDDVFCITYGKIVGRIICVVYIVWLIILMAVQTRLFAERFVITLLIYAPVDFFIISMLVIVYIMSRLRVEAFGRFSQVFSLLLVVIFGIIILSISKDITINNLLPVTFYDTKNILLLAFEIAGICCFFTYGLFFGEKILDKGNVKKEKFHIVLPVVIIALITILTTIGVFGYRVTGNFAQAFSMALKSISIFGSIERIESVLIAFWVVADMGFVVFFMIATSNLAKNTFKLSSRKVAILPIVILLYIVVMLLAKSYIYLIDFVGMVIIPLNLLFGFVIPIMTLGVAKCRKLV